MWCVCARVRAAGTSQCHTSLRFPQFGSGQSCLWNHDWLLIASLPNTSVPLLDPNISARRSRHIYGQGGGHVTLRLWMTDRNKKKTLEWRNHVLHHGKLLVVPLKATDLGKLLFEFLFLKTEKHRVWKISSGYLLQKHPDLVPLIKQSAAVLRLLISCIRQLLRHFFLWEKMAAFSNLTSWLLSFALLLS